MKKKTIVIWSIIVLLIIGVGSAAIYQDYKNKTENENKYAIAIVKDAFIGSVVNVKLTDEGKETYPQAKKYRFVEKSGELMSADVEIGKDNTVLPKQNAGNVLNLVLLDNNENVVDKFEIKLIRE